MGSSEQQRTRRAPLEWLALTLVLVLLGVFLGLDLRRSYREVEVEERERLEGRATMVERTLKARMNATSNALGVLVADARRTLPLPGGASALNEQMRVMVASMVGVRTFVVVDVTGRLVASNRKELIGTEWRTKERYRTIRAHPDAATLYVSPPYLTPLGNWVVTLGRAMIDERGAFDGYVLAIIDPDYFGLLLEATRYAPDMSTAMIHDRGMIIYRVPDPRNAVGMNLSDPPGSLFDRHVRSGRDRTASMGTLRSTGQESLIVFQNVRPTGVPTKGFLVASFAREKAAVYAPWRKQVIDMGALLAVVAAASILGLVLVQRRRATDDRHRAQLAQTARLAAMGTLVAGVAHEVNNPLAGVMTSTGTALEYLRDLGKALDAVPSPERERLGRIAGELEEMLADAMSSSERIAQIVKDLALLGRPEPRRQRVELGDVVRRSQELLPAWVAGRARVHAELETPSGVVAAPGQMEQVVVNLVTNSALAIPDGRMGDVEIRLRPGKAGKVVLEVADDGRGMPPEIQERIFEPFFTTRPQGRGTGLGLSICNAIVTAHGGRITVTSEPGRGSTFRVELPAAPAGA